ncbi:acyl-CoA dehydrogenase family protein [Neobacillus sp. CF12]|uniref:acyl-CoA dehydrogenase family protein n=1 Tax=Neobacillus sp. CF12 TaxID=3055864 RepID=UPI0025A01E10|nr:acyl-CoA dehydrogenase family protein [Neobacillus sp. CF12]MDM5326148.1 acyl-CoA dehydrogenase family protein [Neobacillus sp. CF12]
MSDRSIAVTNIEKKLKQDLMENNKPEQIIERLWDSIKENKLHRLLMDSEIAERNISVEEYLEVLRRFAYVNGGFAFAFHVHQVAVNILSQLMNQQQKEALKDMLEQGKVFGLARSEAKMETRHHFKTTIQKEGSGFALFGRKDYCTLAGIADYYVVFSQSDILDPKPERVQVCLVDGNRPEVEVNKTCQLEALISSCTYSLIFHGYKLVSSELIGNPGDFQRIEDPDLLPLGICAINMGMADSILAKFIENIKVMEGFEKEESLQTLGKMDVRKRGAELLVDESIKIRPPHKEASLCLRRAKGAVDEYVNWTAEEVLRLLGSTGLMGSHHFIELRNDVRASSFMPPNYRKCLYDIGKGVMAKILK